MSDTISSPVPYRQIRGLYDDETITVYQAFAREIAVPAARTGSLACAPFSLDCMTWVKPSFLWMMYRSGWATKPQQEHVLAIRISRTGFEKALAHAVLSHFEEGTYPDHATWEAMRDADPVRVQWDPERDLSLQPLGWRCLQLGLARWATREYVHEWVVGVEDITERVRAVYELLRGGRRAEALVSLPFERAYPLSPTLSRRLGTSG